MMSDVSVEYQPVDSLSAAVTYTDRRGRFLLCGIPGASRAFIATALGLGFAYREVPPGPDAAIEIEIR